MLFPSADNVTSDSDGVEERRENKDEERSVPWSDHSKCILMEFWVLVKKSVFAV